MLRKLVWGVVILVGLGAVIGGAGFVYFRSQLPKEPELSGQLEERTFLYEGQERRYFLYKPAQLAAKPGVMFMLHGSGSDPETSRSGLTYEFDSLADEFGFVTVYPEGFENHWNDCRSALSYSASQTDIDDVSFLLALRQALVQEFSADDGRVFLTGMSNGGHMTYRMAYEQPEAFAGFAVIAANIPALTNFKCQPQRNTGQHHDYEWHRRSHQSI